jgi:hypothetical protein
MNRFIVLVVFPAVLFAAASAHAQCAAVTLSCPSNAVAASLTADDCLASDNSFFDLYQFAGTAGDDVTIEMHATDFDTYAVLLNPAGVPVFDAEDISSSSTDSRMHLTLPQSGTWTIVANSLFASQTGSYTISLTCPAAVTPPAPPRRRVARH